MAKRKERKTKSILDFGILDFKTAWFLLLLILAALGSVTQFVEFISIGVFWLILGILGAIVALIDVRKNEEQAFLLGIIGLMIITTALSIIPNFSQITGALGNFLINLSVGFGLAGLVVALSLIARIGLNK